VTYCRYHCRDCGSHFTSLEAFDAHHEGSGDTLVPCAWPELPAGWEWIEKSGVCKIADPTEPAVGGTYSLIRPGKYGAKGDAERRESAEGSLKEAVLA
jgi:hypothetical protein